MRPDVLPSEVKRQQSAQIPSLSSVMIKGLEYTIWYSKLMNSASEFLVMLNIWDA